VREADVRLTLARGEGSLVPRLYDEAGQYYVFGGLVFASVTWNYAMAVANQFANPQVTAAFSRLQDVPGQQLVVLADVLTGDVNRGYEGEWGELIRAVDGRPVRNLAHLVELVEEGRGEFVTFTDGNGERITLARGATVESTPALLARYGLTADRSPGLGARARNAGGATPPAAATAALMTVSDDHR
jgi:hypothetical protein